MRHLLEKAAVILSTGFGIGFFPKIPGTAASLAAALIYYLTAADLSVIKDPFLFLVFLCPALLMSVLFMSRAEKMMKKDDPRIVLDEFWGFFTAVLLVPKTPAILISAFILFRIFDIFKPFPVNKVQRIPGGTGIIADDILAGIYTNIFLRIMLKTVF